MTNRDIGPTGDYPNGKLDFDDDGGIRVDLSTYRGRIILSFSVPITWLGMNPDQAITIAEKMIEYAKELKKRSG